MLMRALAQGGMGNWEKSPYAPNPPSPGTGTPSPIAPASQPDTGTATPTGPQTPPQQTQTTPAPKQQAQSPIQTEEQYSQANPLPPSTFQEPSLKNRLAHGLFFGMQEFGRAGEGARAEQDWENSLATQRQAASPISRQKEQDTRYQSYVSGEKNVAEAQKAQADAQKALNPPETERLSVDEQLGDALKNNDQTKIQAIIDVKARLWKAEHPDDNTPKDAFQLFMHSWNPADHNGQMSPTYQDFQAEQQKQARESTVPAGILAAHPEPDPRKYPGGQGDPKYVQDHERWGQEITKAQSDLQIQQAEARGAAYGENRIYQQIDTWQGNRPVPVTGKEIKEENAAAQREGRPSRYLSPVGGSKEITKETVVRDIRGSADLVHEDLGSMQKAGQGFDAGTRAVLAASIADPTSTSGQFFQSIPRGTVLSPEQQQYVIDLYQLREQAMNLRAVVGGSAAEDVRRAITQTLPGAATPSIDYGQRQIDALNGVLNRVEKGIANVPLKGDQTPGKPEANAPAAPTEKTYTDADVGAAMAAHPGITRQQIDQAFAAKGWKKSSAAPNGKGGTAK